MALKILLADDSMTAQNMGKKILADAGYDVIAVSNGAAAIKKISSDRPDIAVVDVYMPGYSGLEVCERVKSAAETARMPVLLTVGKMEPFKIEDANRVRADGLLIKPFEASDLAAAISAIAKRLNGPAAAAAKAEAEQAIHLSPPLPDETVRLTADEVAQLDIGSEWQPSEVPVNDIQLSPEIALSPAFMDVLEKDHASVIAPPTDSNADAASASAALENQPVFEIAETELQGGSAPVAAEPNPPAPTQPAVHTEAGADDTHFFGAPAQPLSAVPSPSYGWGARTAEVSSLNTEPAAAAPRQLDPSLELETHRAQSEDVATSPPPEIEFNSAPQTVVETEQASELVVEEVAPVEVAPVTDPALVTDPDEMASFSVHVGTAAADNSDLDLEVQPPIAADTPGQSEPDHALAQSVTAGAGEDIVSSSEAAATVREVEIPRDLDDTQPIKPSSEESESVADLAEKAVSALDSAIAEEIADVTVEEVEPTLLEAPPLAAQDDAAPIHGWLARTPAQRAKVAPANQLSPQPAAASAAATNTVAAAAAGGNTNGAESVSEEAITRAVMRAIERLRPDLIAEISKELGRDRE